MSRYKQVKIPIYGGVCWFYSGNAAKCVAHSKRHRIPEELFSTGRLGACFVQTDNNIVGVYLVKHTDYSTLSHEVLHAVSHIMRQVGIEHNSDTEEAYAYLMNFFVDEWLDKKRWVTI